MENGHGQLVDGCRRVPLVRARNDMLRARSARVRALFEGAGLEWWTLPLDPLVVRASQEFYPFFSSLDVIRSLKTPVVPMFL